MDTVQNITSMFLGNINSGNTMVGKQGNLKKYESAYRSGECMMLSFSRADSVTGDLSLIDDDITVFMPADQISGKAYDLRFRAQKLNDIYCVKVTRVDPTQKIVYVSHNMARLEKRPEIEKEIQKGLKRKKKIPIVVKGKVLKIQTKMVKGEQVDTGVWLDLCGVGIPAFVYVGDWKKTFTESLRGKVTYGDIIDVLVIEKKERDKDVYYYACSRKELVDDPWDSKELSEKYHKGDIVKIQCISKRDTHWFGKINGLNDIQVFAEFPSSRHDFAIVPGMEYMGTIYYINPEERALKVRVFQALSLEEIMEENEVVLEETVEIENEQEVRVAKVDENPVDKLLETPESMEEE